MKQHLEYNDLQRAAIRVFESKERIARQKALIAALKDSGLPTKEAIAELERFERSFLEMQNHRVILSDLLAPDSYSGT